MKAIFHRQGRTGKLNILALLVVSSLGFLPVALAQRNYNAPIEVYVLRALPNAEAGAARLFFVDPVTGEAVTADVRGDRFTVVGGYVLFQNAEDGTLSRAWPDGRVEPHPFIQPIPETARIDWVVSPDGQWIAWTRTDRTADGQLTTLTTLARPDGGDQRVLLQDGPDAFLHIVPLALTDNSTFFFDRQPGGLGGFFFYPQYADVHRLRPEQPAPERLPFEPNCFCAAALSADGQYFVRLEQASDSGGFDARVWDLAANIDTFAPTIAPPYALAGAALVSPEGERVVYSLANNVTLDSAGSGRERFMLVVVEAKQGEQRPLLETPLDRPLLPLAWTDDEHGVLLYNPRRDGTWKLSLDTGEIRQVASATLVGVIRTT